MHRPAERVPAQRSLLFVFVALTCASALTFLASRSLVLGAIASVVVLPPLLWWWRRRKGWRPPRELNFTREGKYIVGITLAVGFGAINTGNNLLYLVLGMLLSMIIVSGVLSEHALRRLSVTRVLPNTVFADRPFLTSIALHNHKKRTPSFSIQVEDIVQGRASTKRCYFLKVPAGAEQRTSYRSDFARRGLYVYEGLRVRTKFPFGFFVKTRRLVMPAEIVVLPRISPIPALPPEVLAQIGVAPRPHRGQGREFHGLRPWRDGDDARDICWKRTARENRLVLREFEADGRNAVTVYLNTRAPVGTTKEALDDAVDLAASLLVHFNRRGSEVCLRTAGGRWIIDETGRGMDAALRALALMPVEATGQAGPPVGGRHSGWLAVTPRVSRRLLGDGLFARVYET